MGQLHAEDQQSGGRASQGTEAGMHLSIEMKNNGVKNGATIGSYKRQCNCGTALVPMGLPTYDSHTDGPAR